MREDWQLSSGCDPKRERMKDWHCRHEVIIESITGHNAEKDLDSFNYRLRRGMRDSSSGLDACVLQGLVLRPLLMLNILIMGESHNASGNNTRIACFKLKLHCFK